ncbi:MAG: T9SS type A sorting domain-containing protein [Cytophagales bacterium]|nr:T9SS type A sorting domain-containing protein [Cytophagales bacterium]
MKNIFTALLVLTIGGQWAFGQDPTVYLPLDQNLNDYSGNGLNATDAGSAATAFVSDSERGMVAFFETAAHAQLPVDPKLNFGTGDFSVAFWIKIENAPGGDPSILSNKDWGSGGNPGFLIALDGADDPANEHMWTSNFADGTGRLDWDADDNGTPNLVDGSWHFVTVVYDRDATMNVYFDGELKQTDPELDSKDLTMAPGDISAAGLPITIMQDGTGAYGDDFEAFVDEIYIYARVLEADEVTNLKNYGLNPAQDVVMGANVYLPFNGNLNDESGNGLHATDAGLEATKFVDDPDRGMVAHFPIDAHAQLPLDPSLDISTGDFSVGFWIKVDEAPESDPSILSNKDWGSGGNPGFLIALDGANDPGNEHMWTSNIADGTGRIDWDADDNATPNLVDGTWHYVVVAYDRDATMNVYFDGELKQTDPELDSKDMTLVPGDIGAGDLPITIMQDGTGAYSADFEAYIDEVRVWNGKVLSAGEVVQSMNAQPGVEKSYAADVYLPLDTDLNDASGNGLNAIDAGSEATVFEMDAERGAVARFPVAAHAQLPLDPMLNFGTGDFSLAFWIKVDNAPGGDPSIMSNKDWGSGGNPGFLIALDGADDPANEHMWTSNFADGTGRLDWDADDNATPNLVDGSWHFVAVTYDRDATMNVYFDGELKQTDPELDSKDLTMAPGDISAANLPITIMQDGTGAYSDDFEALLDDVRVWAGTVVSPLEIYNMYKYKEAAPASDLSFGADVYLPLDENLKDESGNGVDATNAGTEDVIFVEDQQRGLVAEFPTAAHAQFPDHSLLNFGTNDFSVSFWVKISANVPVGGDPVILGNKDWGSGGNPGFQIGLDGADDPAAHMWTVNVSDGSDNGRIDWDADDNSTPNLKDGNWHFVAVAFDRDATMNVYFDGILRQSDPEQDSKDLTLLPGDLNAANLPLTIMQDGTGAYGDDFEARIDDIRIWNNKVITAAEVAAIYNPDDKSYESIVFLPLNNSLYDYSGNNIHAVDKGSEATRFVKDPDRGDVAMFPATAHAQFPLDPKLDFGTNDFSTAFWIRINPSIDTPGDPVILGNKDWGSGGNPGFQIGLDGADDPSAHMWTVNVADGTGRLDWDADDNQTPNLKDGNWHFVAVAFDRDATLNVYFDGELRQTDEAQDSKDLTLAPGSLSGAGLPLTIMQDGTGAYGDDFAALLDNIRVWDRVITDDEVAEMYANDEGTGIGEGESEIVLEVVDDLLKDEEQYFITYPNPLSNGISTISYYLSKTSRVRITLYDGMGNLVKEVRNGISQQGHNSLQWDISGIPAGLYIYKFESAGYSKSLRLILN